MPQPIEQICSQDPIWQLCQKLEALPALVLMAWQMGLFIARAIVKRNWIEG